MTLSEQGKTALITGSYGGLGTQFVNIHASRGGDLILVGRNEEKLKAQQKKYKKNTRYQHISLLSTYQKLMLLKLFTILAKLTTGKLTT